MHFASVSYVAVTQAESLHHALLFDQSILQSFELIVASKHVAYFVTSSAAVISLFPDAASTASAQPTPQ